MSSQKFTAVPFRSGASVCVALPFDPDEVWGARPRHDVTGKIAGCDYRGRVLTDTGVPLLSLGPAWRRGSGVEAGAEVEVVISPEGPQLDNVGADVAAALTADDQALGVFHSLPTFYRKNYMRWIDDAKRAETRAARITEMIALLKAGKRQR